MGRMNRRRLLQFAVTLPILPLAAPFGAGAQTAARMFRIGILIGASSDARGYTVAAFRQGLRDLGYVEGRNVVYEMRQEKESTGESLARLATELAGLPLDLVLVANTQPTLAMREAAARAESGTGTGSGSGTGTARPAALPIVMIEVGDPEASGLVASLARPGGNVTGLGNLDSELAAKRLQLLKEAALGLGRIGVLGNPANPVFAPQWRNVEAAAAALGIELLREDVKSAADLDRAVAAVVERRAEGVLRLIGFRSEAARQRLAALLARHRLPCCTDRASEVRDGVLMSYGPNPAATWRQAAGIADRILRGARPAELAVERPAKFDLALNLAVAKSLGLVFPAAIRARATETVE